MKKKIVLIALIAVLVLSLGLSLAACTPLESKMRDLQNKVNGYEADFTEKTVVVYIGEDDFTVTTRKAFLHDILKDMKKDGLINAYDFSGGELSPYIMQVGDLQQDFAEGKYYSVWHSVDEFSLKSVYSGYMPGRGTQKVEGEAPYQTTFVVTTVGEKTLYYSNVGVGLLPVVDGATYAILID